MAKAVTILDRLNVVEQEEGNILDHLERLQMDTPSVGAVAKKVATGLAERFGLTGPGLVEQITGRPELRYVDLPLRILAAPFVGAGRAAKELTEVGSAAVARGLTAAGVPGLEAAMTPRETPVSRGVGILTEVATAFGPTLVRRAAIGAGELVQETRRLARRANPTAPIESTSSLLVEPTVPRLRVRVGPEGVREVPPPPKLTEPILAQPVHRKIVDAAEEALTKGGVTRDPDKLLSDQVSQLLSEGRLAGQDLDDVLTRHGVTRIQLAQELFRPAVGDAARRLQALSALSQRLEGFAKASPDARAELAALGEIKTGIEAEERLGHFWHRAANAGRRFFNVWRGSLVGQLSTATRNFETQLGRVGLEGIAGSLDAVMQRLYAVGQAETRVSPAEGFLPLLRMARHGTKQKVQEILDHFPTEHDRFFGRWSADVARQSEQVGIKTVDKVFDAAETGVRAANVFNRFQEYLVRNPAFLTRLERNLRRRGLDPELTAAEKMPLAAVRDAVDFSLDMTFAKAPTLPAARHFIGLMNNTPLGLLVPFPRFMMNSIRFFMEFSPAGFLKLLAPAERTAVASGDTHVLSRALLGSAMLGTAWQLRNSEHAGEKWYEFRLSDGKTIDIRPFNPFAAYFWTAEMLKKAKDGTLERLTVRDVAEGLLSANVRGGTGLFLVDRFLDLASSDAKTFEKAKRALTEGAGEIIGGFAVPFRQLRDLVSEFDVTMRTVRDISEVPFTGRIRETLPGVAQQLPEQPSVTRPGPIERSAPLLKQTTGLLVRPAKTPVEREIDRFGLQPFRATGEPEIDRLIRAELGPIVDQLGNAVVKSPRYARLSERQQEFLLHATLAEFRHAARRQALTKATPEQREKFSRLRFQTRPERERRVLEELMHR